MSSGRAVTSVLAALIEDGQGRLLVGRRGGQRARAGKWEFPGGKIQAGEQPEEALRREIREELDMEIEQLQLLDMVAHSYDDLDILLIAYRCRATIPQKLRSADHSELRWAAPPDLPGFDFSAADRQLLNKMFGKQ